MSLTIQSFLNTTPFPSTRWEGFADGVLAFPRALWLERKVVSCSEGNHLKVDHNHVSFTEYFWHMPSNLTLSEVFIMATLGWTGIIMYTVIAVAAAPFLAIGLIFKKIALMKDDASNEHHQHILQAIIKDQKEGLKHVCSSVIASRQI